MREEALELGAMLVEDAERRVARAGDLGGGRQHAVEHRLDVELGDERRAPRRAAAATRRRSAAPARRQCRLRTSISPVPASPTFTLTGTPGRTPGRLVEALEIAGELAPGDLGRRPPQRAARDLGASPSPASRRMKRAQRSVSSMPRSTGVNGSGSTARAGAGGDVRGGGVGLLAGDAALLDRERGDVAGGVDVGHALDAGVTRR